MSSKKVYRRYYDVFELPVPNDRLGTRPQGRPVPKDRLGTRPFGRVKAKHIIYQT